MPVLGPVKRKDLIRYLKECGFEGRIQGAGISLWSEAKSPSGFPIPIKAISEKSFW